MYFIKFSITTFFVLNYMIGIAQTSIEVKLFAELKNAISNSKPGTEILLADGSFSGQTLLSSKAGTAKNPVVIRAKNQGKAIIESEIKIQGDYISLIGCKFEKGGCVIFEGTGCRLSRCTFSDSKALKWVRISAGSMNMEIDHNLFENKTNNRDFEKNCQLMQIIVRNQNEQHRVHHNLFQNIPQGKSGNGFETLQLITENNPFDPPAGDCNSIIENNLFLRCNGESEIISVKSNGNILRGNTFRDCKGGLVLRHGDNNNVTQNFFFGENESGSGGVRLQGTGQVVANNYFFSLGQYGVGMMDGTPDDLYIRVERAQILFNTFVNCAKTMEIGLNHSSHPNGTPPKDCTIAGNIFYTEKNHALIQFVQNDQPENWKWQDNIAFGGSADNIAEGILNQNPNLDLDENHIAWPTSSTPQSKFTNEWSGTDLLGKIRNTKTTVGAIQLSSERKITRVLTEGMVGPEKSF